MRIAIKIIVLLASFLILQNGTGLASCAYGDEGQDVTVVQQFLYRIGQPIEITGVFDDQTMTAVEQYQNMHFLPVTGQVDETTIMRMFGQSDIPSTYTSGLGNEWFPILLLKTAESFIGVPYVWGGDSPSGFDCSGFIQYVFQQMGLKLPRTADEQFNYGYIVQKDQLLPGDLVFFETYEPGPSHVGIYYNAHYFIHADSAAGMITFDTLDRAYREETFLGGRRMFLW